VVWTSGDAALEEVCDDGGSTKVINHILHFHYMGFITKGGGRQELRCRVGVTVRTEKDEEVVVADQDKKSISSQVYQGMVHLHLGRASSHEQYSKMAVTCSSSTRSHDSLSGQPLCLGSIIIPW
jgi:hypothetical protein